MSQLTNSVFMVRPVAFGFNPETAESNVFQNASLAGTDLQVKALAEFDSMVVALRSDGVKVWVFEDTPQPNTPDSIFPNNWISTHSDGQVVLYPMLTPNRRAERRQDIIDGISQAGYFLKNPVVDLTGLEQQGLILEGTGSLVLDRVNKIAYAVLSPRTSPQALAAFESKMGYRSIRFSAFGGDIPVYHTNVVMSLGEKYCLICLESIPSDAERSAVRESLESTGHEVIEISLDQMNHFAGNALQLIGSGDSRLIVMSQQALDSLSPSQVEKLSAHGKLVSSSLETIEAAGGGSARCMIAEIHLPQF